MLTTEADLEPITEHADEALLVRFSKSGDRDALGLLARRHEMHLLGMAKGLLGGDQMKAQDAVQNAWVKVVRYGRSFEGRSSVRTWLFRIVINQCRQLRERESRRGAAATVAAARLGGTARAESCAEVDPHERTEASEFTHAVATALDRLSADQREVLLLCYHAELTHPQAAEVIGLPVGTLKSRLHAALQSLRAALSKEVAR